MSQMLRASARDAELLQTQLSIPRKDAAGHPTHYRDCVVLKPWGYEFEMFDDRLHAMWMLCIKPGQATSLHCHQHKTACFVPAKGQLTLRTLDQILPITEPISIEPKVFHSLENSTDQDGYLIEVESPSVKLDLIRAEDGYGRFREGYEGGDHIVREELSRFNHVHFGEDEVVECLGIQIIVTPAGFSIRRPVDA